MTGAKLAEQPRTRRGSRRGPQSQGHRSLRVLRDTWGPGVLRVPRQRIGVVVAVLAAWLGPEVWAAAPPRAVPYAEELCRSDPSVFFCEDFEGGDISLDGTIGDSSQKYWRNPAIDRPELYWGVGGSHQRSTIPLPGVDQASNHVWRITTSPSFPDIVTGHNPGTGGGQLGAWLREDILGSGAREWYTRMQIYLSHDYRFPGEYDFKMFFALPREFPSMPGADYETGMQFHEDFFCPSLNRSFSDVVSIRYRANFNAYPLYEHMGAYCPPLAPGQPANGVNAPRLEKGRWYTLEYHVKLAQDDTGILELWVDGDQAYAFHGPTCETWACPDMGFIMLMGWMHDTDPQGGYVEYDHIVMSRRAIGPPAAGGASAPPVIPGDLNGDGRATLADLIVLIKMLLGQVPPDLAKGDLDGSGSLGVGDVRALVQRLVTP